MSFSMIYIGLTIVLSIATFHLTKDAKNPQKALIASLSVYTIMVMGFIIFSLVNFSGVEEFFTSIVDIVQK